MSMPRPLTKEILKKMFLVVLNEHKRLGGFYANHGWDFRGILKEKIAQYFKIDRLSEEEYGRGLRAVFELEVDGYIMEDPSQESDSFKILTDEGKEAIKESLEKMSLPSINIDKILTKPELRNKIHDDFIDRDYESAIFKAFKLLEEKVRAKAKLSLDDLGADLMSKAFGPQKGVLKHARVQTQAEVEAIHHLMRGGIMLFKNPVSHRTVKYDEPEEVAHVLAFANLLLNITDQCELSDQ